MRQKLYGRTQTVWVAGILALAGLFGVGLSSAFAQTPPKPAAATKPATPGTASPIVRPANTRAPLITSGSGPYYIEFRSRYAWDYGHTYIVHGRVGEAPNRASVAGLSPVGDDATAWVIGHYVPVPAETGWTDGDLEDKYVSARYRVLMNKDQYDRIMAYVRELQGRSHSWSAELYNCNAFVADIAREMGLKVPSSTLIYPKIFVTHLRLINTGHPEAEQTLVSDNVKEMSNPTRDGRAMKMSGIYTIHPDGTPSSNSPVAPSVTIGSLRVSNKGSGSSAPSQ